MEPRPNTSLSTVSVSVSFTSPQAREEFKRLVASHRDALRFGEPVLIGDRIVVKGVTREHERSLRAQLDELLQLAETRARAQAEFHEASRRELLDAVMAQSRARATASRFEAPRTT